MLLEYSLNAGTRPVWMTYWLAGADSSTVQYQLEALRGATGHLPAHRIRVTPPRNFRPCVLLAVYSEIQGGPKSGICFSYALTSLNIDHFSNFFPCIYSIFRNKMQHKKTEWYRHKQRKNFMYTLTEIGFKKWMKQKLKADYNTVHHQSIHQ